MSEKTRLFKYRDKTFPDPGAEHSVEAVRQVLVTFFPELARCRIDTNEEGDTIVVEFVKQATTKGRNAQKPAPIINRLVEGLNQVTAVQPQAPTLYRQLEEQLPNQQPLNRLLEPEIGELIDTFFAATQQGEYGCHQMARRCQQRALPVPSSETEASRLHFAAMQPIPPRPEVDQDPQWAEAAINLLNAARLAERQQIFQQPELPLGTYSLAAPHSIWTKIEQFLKRVDDEFFPLDWELLDYPTDGVCWQLENIPLWPQGVCYELDAYGLMPSDGFNQPEPINMLMHIGIDELYDLHWHDEDRPLFATSYPDFAPLPDDFTLSNVLSTLNKMELAEPLNQLGNLIRIVLKQTDTALLDVSYDEYCQAWEPPRWDDLPFVYGLQQEWQEAQPLVQGRDALLNYCQVPLYEFNDRLRKILAVLREAYHWAQGKRPLPLVWTP